VLWAEVVREKDEFTFTDYPQEMRHVRYRGDGVDDPSSIPLKAVYSVARFRDGTEHFMVMLKDEIEKARKTSASAARPESPWNVWPAEMWKKTVLKRHCKILPMSTDRAQALHRAVELDDKAEAGIDQALEVPVEIVEDK